MLAMDPDLLNKKFKYETTHNGMTQEGSGFPMHLAASRGHLDVAAILFEKKASLFDCVTRGNENHYDVIHAAVFHEGKKPSREQTAMVRQLIQWKANPRSMNLAKETPIDLACKTGAIELLPILWLEEENSTTPTYLQVENEKWDMNPQLWEDFVGNFALTRPATPRRSPHTDFSRSTSGIMNIDPTKSLMDFTLGFATEEVAAFALEAMKGKGPRSYGLELLGEKVSFRAKHANPEELKGLFEGTLLAEREMSEADRSAKLKALELAFKP